MIQVRTDIFNQVFPDNEFLQHISTVLQRPMTLSSFKDAAYGSRLGEADKQKALDILERLPRLMAEKLLNTEETRQRYMKIISKLQEGLIELKNHFGVKEEIGDLTDMV